MRKLEKRMNSQSPHRRPPIIFSQDPAFSPKPAKQTASDQWRGANGAKIGDFAEIDSVNCSKCESLVLWFERSPKVQ
jgi:hypothetical protein